MDYPFCLLQNRLNRAMGIVSRYMYIVLGVGVGDSMLGLWVYYFVIVVYVFQVQCLSGWLGGCYIYL